MTPVVLLHGPDAFLIEEAVARLTRLVCPDPGLLSMCREVLEAREAGPEGHRAGRGDAAVGRAAAVGRGPRRRGARPEAGRAAGRVRCAPRTRARCWSSASLSRSLRLTGSSRRCRRGVVVELPQLAGRALAAWLRSRASADGLELGRRRLSSSSRSLATIPPALAGEVVKAALAGGAREPACRSGRGARGGGRAPLARGLRAHARRGAADAAAALPLLERLLAAGEEPLRILAILPDTARRATPRAARVRLERCWQAERRLKLGGAAAPGAVGPRRRSVRGVTRRA